MAGGPKRLAIWPKANPRNLASLRLTTTSSPSATTKALSSKPYWNDPTRTPRAEVNHPPVRKLPRRTESEPGHLAGHHVDAEAGMSIRADRLIRRNDG